MPGAQEAQIYECPSPGTDKAGKRQPRGFSQGELFQTLTRLFQFAEKVK